MSGNLEGFAWAKNYWSEKRPFSVIYNLLLKYFLFFSFYSNLLISIVFSYFQYFLFFSSFLSISSVLPEGNKKDRDKKSVKEKGLTKTTSGGPRGPGKLYFSLSCSSLSSSSVRPVMEASLFEVYLLSTLTCLLYSLFLSS